jgi:hypothetical protein
VVGKVEWDNKYCKAIMINNYEQITISYKEGIISTICALCWLLIMLPRAFSCGEKVSVGLCVLMCAWCVV